MNAEMLLDDLAGLGIHLVRDGDAILADVADGADIAPHTARITACKPALVAALHLRERIVAGFGYGNGALRRVRLACPDMARA